MAAGADQAKDDEPPVTAPARPIDTKQLSETVKEEVKGGEASAGADARSPICGRPSKPELIKDEPLAVKVPRGLAAAHAQDLRAGLESDHQRQV